MPIGKENNIIDLALNTAEDMKGLIVMMKYLNHLKRRKNEKIKENIRIYTLYS